MSVMQFVSVAALAAITGMTGPGASVAYGNVTIPTLPVGRPGNAADSTGYGSVAYLYNIGRTEVTNAQYTAFLNAVAASDPNGLYNTNMDGSFGGIARSGSNGSYIYSTVAGRENNPVTSVSFWSATRFANWLHNGQPIGGQTASTTEDGAYTLTPVGISANTITRNAGWRWAVMSEDEFYKAAYHQPATQGGDSDDYWFYPTSSNNAPTSAEANYGNAVGNTTPVGSYAANHYGTFDMGGNVWEWTEVIVAGPYRGVRGGAFSGSFGLRAEPLTHVGTASGAGVTNGFRLVQIPAPSAAAVLAIVGLAVNRRRRSSPST